MSQESRTVNWREGRTRQINVKDSAVKSPKRLKAQGRSGYVCGRKRGKGGKDLRNGGTKKGRKDFRSGPCLGTHITLGGMGSSD